MTIATPAYAAVRPRIIVKGTSESRLLEEVMSEIVDDFRPGIVRITGGCGSGKTTALAHLAAAFSYDERFLFLDEPSSDELNDVPEDSLVIATMPPGGDRGIEWKLQPWGLDELIEYLLVKHHDACGSVVRRLGAAAGWSWSPELACIVLDRLAANEDLDNPIEALSQRIVEGLPTSNERSAVELFCLAMLAGKGADIETAAGKLSKAKCTPEIRRLLRHRLVQLPLAARRLTSIVEQGAFGELELRLPIELVEVAGRHCRENAQATERLVKFLASKRNEPGQAMGASILHAADPGWRPVKRRKPWDLSGGIFRDAQWSELDLSHASLSRCDFTDANLDGAVLDGAVAVEIQFDGASLRGASLLRITAIRARFVRANLERAKLPNALLAKADFTEANLAAAALMMADLTEADLTSALLPGADLSRARLFGATLEDADLSNAVLRGADLSGIDLRQVRLDGACLDEANLRAAQMENLRIERAKLQNARLQGAYLTGTSMPAADLRGADLSGAALAEIVWEGADLRGANLRSSSFHMGSSRSGLVGSPIACEGSKTGFYTDDLEDMNFKRPEEIRKANLRGADLRGAKAERVDFYLVDLRDARLDAALREQVRQTGAILEDSAE